MLCKHGGGEQWGAVQELLARSLLKRADGQHEETRAPHSKLESAQLEEIVRNATAEAVRHGLAAGLGLGTMRQIFQEELNHGDENVGEDNSNDEDDDKEEGWKLIICVRHDLKMTVGKVAAQVGHAVHAALSATTARDLHKWEAEGSKKVTLKVDSEEQLLEIQAAACKNGLVAEYIQDAGRTEVEPGTKTVLAVGPACDKDIDSVTGHLRPLPDRAQKLEAENKKLRDRAERLQKELDHCKRCLKNMTRLDRQGLDSKAHTV